MNTTVGRGLEPAGYHDNTFTHQQSISYMFMIGIIGQTSHMKTILESFLKARSHLILYNYNNYYY